MMDSASWDDIRAGLHELLDQLLANSATEQSEIDSCALALNIDQLMTLAAENYAQDGRGFILLQPKGRAGLADLTTLVMTYYAMDDTSDMDGDLAELADHIRTYDPVSEVVVVIERDGRCHSGKLQVPDALQHERRQPMPALAIASSHKKEGVRLQKQLLHLLRDPKADVREIDRLYLSIDPLPVIKLGSAGYQQHGRGVVLLHLRGRKDLANPTKVPREYVPIAALVRSAPDWFTPAIREHIESCNPLTEALVVTEREGRYRPSFLMVRTPPMQEASLGTQATMPSGPVRLGDGRRLMPDGTIPPELHGKRWSGSDGMIVVATIDQTNLGPAMHVSLSYPKRDPSLRDAQLVREAFFPSTANVMMQLPSGNQKLHIHCYHLWQVPEIWTFAETQSPSVN